MAALTGAPSARAGRWRGAITAALGALLAIVPCGQVGAQAPAGSPVPATRELVVLVHGMGRTSFSMRPLAQALEADGYDVMSFGYSSVCCSIPELGEQLRVAVAARRGETPTVVHFVGHSLGNILVRWVLTRDTLPPLVGRVVMLAPPNQGAEAADRLAPVTGWLLRPISDLTTDSLSAVQTLPPVRGVEIGVISARDDGKVSLTESHLEEETAHIVVDGGHAFIMRRADVHARVIEFLHTGHFALTGPATAVP